MKYIILYISVALIPVISTAQPHPMPMGNQDQPRREQIKMLRIWKMTEELNLTESQAEKFFPRLRKEDKEIEKLEHERQVIFRELNKGAKEGGLKENELYGKIDQLSDIETNIIKKRATFVKNMNDLLDTDQQAKLIVFRHRFRERMSDMMRDAKRKRQMQNRRNNR